MVSNKKADNGPKRPYRLKERARRQESVHRRITEVAEELHRTVGPARTKVSEIAKLAGVQRATVYNHFPTDVELIDACSSHWVAEHPPPDPEAWLEIPQPTQRVEVALAAMYDYFERGRDMLENVLRDAPLVPALDEINRRKWWPMIEGLVDLLAQGWDVSIDACATPAAGTGKYRPEPPDAIRASLWVALDFFTWQTLSRSGLTNQEAARLAAAWVAASA